MENLVKIAEGVADFMSGCKTGRRNSGYYR